MKLTWSWKWLKSRCSGVLGWWVVVCFVLLFLCDGVTHWRGPTSPLSGHIVLGFNSFLLLVFTALQK